MERKLEQVIKPDTLQHPAAHCNTLQHTATHCNTLQHAALKNEVAASYDA